MKEYPASNLFNHVRSHINIIPSSQLKNIMEQRVK